MHTEKRWLVICRWRSVLVATYSCGDGDGRHACGHELKKSHLSGSILASDSLERRTKIRSVSVLFTCIQARLIKR